MGRGKIIHETKIEIKALLEVGLQLVKKLFAHPRKDTLFHYLLFNQKELRGPNDHNKKEYCLYFSQYI